MFDKDREESEPRHLSEASDAHRASHDFASLIPVQDRARGFGRYIPTQSKKASKLKMGRLSRLSTLVSRIQRIYLGQSWATRGQFRSFASNEIFTKPLMRWANGIGYTTGQSDPKYRQRPRRQILRALEPAELRLGRLENHHLAHNRNAWLEPVVKPRIRNNFLTSLAQSKRDKIDNPYLNPPTTGSGVRRSFGLRTSSSAKDTGPAVTGSPVSREGSGITRRMPGAVLSREVGDPDWSEGRLMEVSVPAGGPSPIVRRSLSSAARMVYRTVRAGLFRPGPGVPGTAASRTGDKEQAHPSTTRVSGSGVRRSFGLRTSSSAKDTGPAVTGSPVSRVIWREMSDPGMRRELSAAKTSVPRHEQKVFRDISRRARDMQRLTDKTDSWSSDGSQPVGGGEASLSLALQYRRLISDKRNLGKNDASHTTSAQRSYQPDPGGLQSTHPAINVGPGSSGPFDVQNQDSIQRSPNVVQRQTNGIFRSVPGMAKYDYVGEWLEKQLPTLHEALRTLDLETENSEEKFKEEEIVFLSDRIYDYLRNRLTIENERTGWHISPWVH